MAPSPKAQESRLSDRSDHDWSSATLNLGIENRLIFAAPSSEPIQLRAGTEDLMFNSAARVTWKQALDVLEGMGVIERAANGAVIKKSEWPEAFPGMPKTLNEIVSSKLSVTLNQFDPKQSESVAELVGATFASTWAKTLEHHKISASSITDRALAAVSKIIVDEFKANADKFPLYEQGKDRVWSKLEEPIEDVLEKLVSPSHKLNINRVEDMYCALVMQVNRSFMDASQA